jgi:hypothetical protein
MNSFSISIPIYGKGELESKLGVMKGTSKNLIPWRAEIMVSRAKYSFQIVCGFEIEENVEYRRTNRKQLFVRSIHYLIHY